jgi:hypothetical protein
MTGISIKTGMVEDLLSGSKELEPRQTEKRPRGEGRNKRPKSHFQLSLPETAPPPPEIVRSLPIDSDLTRFTWTLVDDVKCVGYSIYRGAVDNADVAERVDYIGQPGNHRQGSLTWDDPFPSSESRFYWVASNNAAGIESPRVKAKTNRLTEAEAGDDTTIGGTPPIEIGPIVLTDFLDQTRWIQIGSSEITKTVAAGGVTLAGKAHIWRPAFSGVALRGLIYGDAADGEITIKHYWDSFVRPTDLTAVESIGWGIEMAFQSTAERGIFNLYISPGSLTTNDALTAGVLTTTGYAKAGFATFTIATPAAASFTMETRIRHAIGGFRDMAQDYLDVLVDGTGPVQGGAFGASRRTVTFGPPSGLSLRAGVFLNDNTTDGSARLTKVEILKGQFVAF